MKCHIGRLILHRVNITQLFNIEGKTLLREEDTIQYSDLQAAVQDTVGDTNAAGLARIKRYINFGQQRVASLFDWPFLKTTDATITTAANDEEYSLASDFAKMIAMRDTTNENWLTEMSKKDFDASKPAVSTTEDAGYPEYWYATDLDSSNYQQIKLYPVPDGIYTITYDYYKTLADLSADTDVSDIPAKYHQALVDYACFKYYQKEQDEQATQFHQEFQNTMADMMADLKYESENLAVMKPATAEHQKVRDLRF